MLLPSVAAIAASSLLPKGGRRVCSLPWESRQPFDLGMSVAQQRRLT